MAEKTIQINPQDNLVVRFWNHAQLGLSKNIQEHKRNWVERAGDTVVWNLEDMPFLVWEKMKDPRFVTVVLTKLALAADSFAFYPEKSWEATKTIYENLPLPPFWAVKFGCYLATCSLILGYSSRAYGRFSNKELMATAYRQIPTEAPAGPTAPANGNKPKNPGAETVIINPTAPQNLPAQPAKK